MIVTTADTQTPGLTCTQSHICIRACLVEMRSQHSMGCDQSSSVWGTCCPRPGKGSTEAVPTCRTPASESHSADCTAGSSSERCTCSCCLVMFSSNSARPMQTPCRLEASSACSHSSKGLGLKAPCGNAACVKQQVRSKLEDPCGHVSRQPTWPQKTTTCDSVAPSYPAQQTILTKPGPPACPVAG